MNLLVNLLILSMYIVISPYRKYKRRKSAKKIVNHPYLNMLDEEFGVSDEDSKKRQQELLRFLSLPRDERLAEARKSREESWARHERGEIWEDSARIVRLAEQNDGYPGAVLD